MARAARDRIVRSRWPLVLAAGRPSRRRQRAPDRGRGAEAHRREVAALRGPAAGLRRQGQDQPTSAGRSSASARTGRASRCCASRRRPRSRASRCWSSTIRTARPISGCGRRPSSATGASRCRIARRASSAPTSASRISRSATSISTTTSRSATIRSTARRAGRFESTPKQTKSSQYTQSLVWIRKDNYALARIENFVKDEVVRRLVYSDIRNVQGIWTARQLEMADLRRGSRTRLTLDKLEYNVAAEGRRLHAAGHPPAVNGARAVAAIAHHRGDRWRLPHARAQTVSSRGFVEGVGYAFPQLTSERHCARSSAICWRARSCSSRPPTGCGSPRASTFGPIRTIRSRPSGVSIFEDRGVQRPKLSVRRLSATVSKGGFNVDVGKQFIRWGKTDIIHPTDRFAPSDFINVISSEFLPVAGVRGVVSARWRDASRRVWTRLTPSRVPLLDQRWTAVPQEAVGDPARGRRGGVSDGHADRRSDGATWVRASSTRCRSSTASTTSRTFCPCRPAPALVLLRARTRHSGVRRGRRHCRRSG